MTWPRQVSRRGFHTPAAPVAQHPEATTRQHGWMEVAELVLRYVDVLAWPTVVLALGWLLRRQLRGAFARLTRLETPAGSLEFEAELREVREHVERVTDSRREESPEVSPADGSPDAGGPLGAIEGAALETLTRGFLTKVREPYRTGFLQAMKEIRSPVLAVWLAWSTTMEAVQQTTAGYRDRDLRIYRVKAQEPLAAALEAATLDSDLVESFTTLDALQKEARRVNVSEQAALDFLVSCARLVAELPGPSARLPASNEGTS
jgi:hypothetical protein